MAEQKNPDRVISIFRFRRKQVSPAQWEEYTTTGARMMEIATAMPGFISFREYKHPDGEFIGVTEWASVEALAQWREHPEHRKAQARGRELFYTEYEVVVCKPIHEYSFKRSE